MIEKIECEILHCDGCNRIYENFWGGQMFIDVERRAIKCSGWVKDGDKHYCRPCAKIKGLVND